MAGRIMVVMWLLLWMAMAAGDTLTESALEGKNKVNVNRVREANVKEEGHGFDKKMNEAVGAADDDDNPGEKSKESGAGKDEDVDTKSIDKAGAEEGDGGAVRVRVVVGEEADWARGRVEETQLLASAHAFNYNIQVHYKDELPDCGGDEEDNHILVFLPRAEGLLQADGGAIAAALRDAGADIILPNHLTALAGWARTLQEAAREAGATSLAQLAEHLRQKDALRQRYRAELDTESRVFHVLDDTSDVGDDGVSLSVREGRYEVQVRGRVPPILLAQPGSVHGRALLLALSDYLTGTHHPEHGCVSCLPADKIPLKVAREMVVVVVGVFVRRPQPFLNESLSSLLLHGLHPNTHFYVYNQVQQYGQVVEDFVARLRQEARNVTLLQPPEAAMGEADVKNMILQECVRLGCRWFLHIDSDVFLNPGIPALLLSQGHPVLAPALRIQKGIQASFWRDMDTKSSSPAHSWDHAHLLSEERSARGYWHASCVRGVYAIRHDILARLTTPYSPAHPAPQPQPDATDRAFCSALREAGVPMVVTTAIPNLGVMLNTTHHGPRTPDLTSCVSNPILWNLLYLTPTWTDIMNGKFSKVLKPCDEVYQYRTFSPRFANDLLRLAYQRDQWSPALPQDLRKEVTGVEAVPTVDQWTSQLGLDHLMDYIFHQVLKNQQLIAFPYSMPDEVVHSLVARFRPNEVAGMPNHHDASSITFHVHLTPLDHYQGGELEFPKQRCLLKPELGDILVFPGRLTHPKVLHNVTDGILHKMIIHTDAPEFTLRY